MRTVVWDGRRRLMAATAICAAVVAIEAIALVAAGGHSSGNAVRVQSGAAIAPFQGPRSVANGAPAAPPTTVAPSLPAVQEVVATMPVVAQPLVPAAAAKPAPAPATTTIPAKPAASQTPAPAPAAAPLPTCRAADVTATVMTDRPVYQQNDTVTATGTIRNVSGHDCAAPAYDEVGWCDGGSVCVSSAGPISSNATPDVWAAGTSRTATETWAFGQGDHPFTPQPGTGNVKFTWHLDNAGSVASASANFQIDGPPASTTTSSTPTTAP